MPATGELIRMMNYVDDIAATLRRVQVGIATMTADEKKRLADYMRNSDPSFIKLVDVRTIGVIGAGSIGRGIAHAAALGGYRTILEDILPASLRRAEAEVRRDLARAIAAGEVRKEDADAALLRIEFAATMEHTAREADLVIEAMPEDMESKIEIF